MNLIDVIFFGWYQILDKTIYLNKIERIGIGPKEHSFFITFLFLGINVWSILRYLVAKYYHLSVSMYVSLSLSILIFAIGYLFYLRRDRINTIITHEVKMAKMILCVIIAMAYAAGSVYLMFKVGDYVRFTINR